MSSDLLDGVTIVDADTHLTEPHDLWTSRAPTGWEERVPQVKLVDGTPMWTIEGDVMGGASGASVVGPDGTKMYGTDFMGMGIDEVHAGASQVAPRLAVMDEMGHTDPGLALRVYRQAMRRGEEEKAQLRALVEGSDSPWPRQDSEQVLRG